MQYSPKRVSQAIGVSEASLKRWCDQGRLQFTRTPGGHRRISRDAVLRFVRENEHRLIAPALLGLSGRARKKEGSEVSAEQVSDMLIAGDEAGLRSLVSAYCLSQGKLAPLFDRILGPAFKRLGCEWKAGRADIFQERRGCEICRRLVAEILQTLPAPAPNAPLAIGGALSGDPYDLASIMVEAALREMGWDGRSLGSNLPVETLIKAIQNLKPRLFWLSISSVAEDEQLTADCGALYEACRAAGCLLVVGGMALDANRRARLRYTSYCDTIAHLVDFVDSVAPLSGMQ